MALKCLQETGVKIFSSDIYKYLTVIFVWLAVFNFFRVQTNKFAKR